MAGSVGGALYSLGPGELLRCEFRDNIAGGGGAVGLESDWTVKDCTFRTNRAYESGGALLLQLGDKEITGCTFAGNATHRDGGAVYDLGGHVTCTTCIFAGNTATYGGVVSAKEAVTHTVRGRQIPIRFYLALDSCTVADNLSAEGPKIWCSALDAPGDSEASTLILSNCILDSGSDEIRYQGKVQTSIAHTDLCGGLNAIQDPCDYVTWGPGNIDVNPFFAVPGYWDPNGTPDFSYRGTWNGSGSPDDLSNDAFVEGDYHLKSQAGRRDEASASWVQDDVTSPCIDAGDPNSPVGDEPFPNGGVINMGAYGGTAEASMSPMQGPTAGQ